MFYFLCSINFISENLLLILNIVIATTTCSVAHFFRSSLGTAYQLTIALKHTVLQSLMASNSELFIFAHNSGRSAPWAELGLSVHLLGFPQFLMCFTGVGWPKTAPAGVPWFSSMWPLIFQKASGVFLHGGLRAAS